MMQQLEAQTQDPKKTQSVAQSLHTLPSGATFTITAFNSASTRALCALSGVPECQVWVECNADGDLLDTPRFAHTAALSTLSLQCLLEAYLRESRLLAHQSIRPTVGIKTYEAARAELERREASKGATGGAL